MKTVADPGFPPGGDVNPLRGWFNNNNNNNLISYCFPALQFICKMSLPSKNSSAEQLQPTQVIQMGRPIIYRKQNCKERSYLFTFIGNKIKFCINRASFNKDAFQQDAYCPPVDCILRRDSLPPEESRGVCFLRSGTLSRNWR